MTEIMNWDEIRPGAIERASKALDSMSIVAQMGIQIETIELGEAVLSLEMKDSLKQPGGLLHGGVIATLIDTAMAFAIRTGVPSDVPTATIDLTIHYLRPHTDGKAVCTAKVVRSGKRIITVIAEVANENGKLVATALSTYTRL